MARGPRGGRAVQFSFNDARRLQHALLLEQKDLVKKKKRWLLQSPSEKYRRPKLSTDLCMLEPYTRNEISSKAIRSHVERAFGPLPNNQGSYHFILDFMQLFDMDHRRIKHLNDWNISEMLLSIIELLNDEARVSVAFLVVNDNEMVNRTHEKMSITKENLPRFLEQQKYSDGTSLKHLLHILQKPSSFLQRQSIVDISVNQDLLSSISRILDQLHELSTQELLAMLRKLKGVRKIPQLPVVWRTCKRDSLIEKVRKLCLDLFPQEGHDLPTPLAKALSVFNLSLKCKSIFVNQTKFFIDQPMLVYFHFPPKVICMQSNIISALRSLSVFFRRNKRKQLSVIHSEKLKALQSLLDPEGRCFAEKFKGDLKKYLLEYLFECDEVTITEEVTRAIDILNMSSECQPFMFSEVTIEEESKAVLNVSSELRKHVLGLLPHITDDKSQDTSLVEFGSDTSSDRYTSLEEFESGKSSESDDFDLSATDYYNSGVCKYKEILDSGSNYEDVSSANSILQVNSTMAVTAAIPSLTNFKAGHTIESEIIDVNCKESMNISYESTSNENRRTAEDIAGETALVAYKLIGFILDKLMMTEGKNISLLTKCYLNGFGSTSADSIGPEVPSSTSNEDVKDHLIQALEELVPSLSAGTIQRVKNMMELPFSSEAMP